MKALKELEDEPTLWRSFIGMLKELWGVIAALPGYLVKLNQRWNEAWLIVLCFFLWKYADVVMGYIDPTSPAQQSELCMCPLWHIRSA